jgi:hypothetical protein
MKSFLIFLFFTVSPNLHASNCPDLSGKYLEPGSKIMEIKQSGCEKLEIYMHWANSKGEIIHEGTNPYIWELGDTSTNCGHHIGVDCRPHPFNANEILTLGNGSKKRFPGTTDPTLCRYSEFSWSLDSDNNLVDTTPVTCEDGFIGEMSFTRMRVN